MLLSSGISQHSLTLDTRHLSHTPLEGRSVRHIIVYISKDFLPAMVDIMTKIGDKINFKYHIHMYQEIFLSVNFCENGDFNNFVKKYFVNDPRGQHKRCDMAILLQNLIS